MRFLSFHIDSFGALSKVNVEDLSPGLNIFLGPNEAGKSTCLEFLRSVLIGYQIGEGRFSGATKKGRKQTLGGSAWLDTEHYGHVQLSRQTGKGQGLAQLRNESGKALDIALLDSILAKVSPDLYRSIYGISHMEMQNFTSLKGEHVRSALYGASFGLGLQGGTMAQQRLEEEMAHLFRAGGSNTPFQMALRHWEEKRQAMFSEKKIMASYDALCLEERVQTEALEKLFQERADLEKERKKLERLHQVWKSWQERGSVLEKLAALPSVPVDWPNDGAIRVEKLLERQEENIQAIAETRSQFLSLYKNTPSPVKQPEFMAAWSSLVALNGQKLIFQEAVKERSQLESAHESKDQERDRLLTSLGPDWNLKRIGSMDLSLETMEQVETFANQSQEIQSRILAANSAMEASLQDVEQVRKRLGSAVDFPASSSSRSPGDSGSSGASNTASGKIFTRWDTLRNFLVGVEEARHCLPERYKKTAHLQSEYKRLLARLNLRAEVGNAEVEKLMAQREGIMQLADTISQSIDIATQVENQLKQEQRGHTAAEEQLGKIRAQLLISRSHNHQVLSQKKDVVRRLRQNQRALNQEKDRLKDFTERKQTLKSSLRPPKTAWLLVFPGALLILFGVFTLIGKAFFGLEYVNLSWLSFLLPFNSLAQGSGLVPLNVLSAVIALLLGVLFFFLGQSKKTSQYPKNSAAQEALDQYAASVATVRSLEAEAEEIGHVLGLRQADGNLLETLEFQLETERDQGILEARMQKEAELLGVEVNGKLLAIDEWSKRSELAQEAVQGLLQSWRNEMLRLGFSSPPSPETAQAMFGKLDALRETHRALVGVREEIRELHQRRGLFMKLAQDMMQNEILPPINELSFDDTQNEVVMMELAEGLPEDLVLGEYVRITRRFLHSKQVQEELATEQVITPEQADLKEKMEQLMSIHRQKEQFLYDCISYKEALQANWQNFLGSIGLSPSFSPQTAKEALRAMERCLQLVQDKKNIGAEKERIAKQIQSFLDSVSHLLKKLQLFPEKGIQEEEAPRLLEHLWAQALEAREQDDYLQKYQAKRDSLGQTLHSNLKRQKELQDAAQSLMKQSGCENLEQLRQFGQGYEKRQNLEQKLTLLEDVLSLAAAPQDRETFYEELDAWDSQSLKERLERIESRFVRMDDEEKRIQTVLGDAQTRVNLLQNSKSTSEVALQEEAGLQRIGDLTEEWCTLALARSLLANARRSYEVERQPEVVRLASGLFATMTGGAWEEIYVSLESGDMEVRTGNKKQDPELLSRGAQEQLYLSLRLAFLRTQARQTFPLPVLMDDLLVNFDPKRAAKAIEALTDLCQPKGGYPGHQLLFYTCHPSTAEQLHESAADSALFMVEKAKIKPKSKVA